MKPLWITARELMKRTGLNKYDLRTIRLDNPAKGFYKQETEGSFRYDWNKLKSLLIQTA